MNTGKKTSNAFLIAANLVPLIGVLFLGWDGKGVFVIYILETILIGALNVLKMLVVYILNGNSNEPAPSANENVRSWGLIPFFIFHYYFFIFVQSILFFAFSSIWHPSASDPENLIANFAPYLQGPTAYALISLLIANLTYFIEGFILGGQYKTESMSGLMFQPYKRIFIQQFVVIFGGFIFMLSGSAAAVAALFVVLKTAADYFAANYASNPKITNWIKAKIKDKNGAELTEEEKQQIESMFGGK